MNKSIDQENSIVNVDGLPKDDKVSLQGINGDPLTEPLPEYIQTTGEVIVSGQGDAYIVFGRDRPGHRSTGYGGKGHTKASSIDVVVGRLGSEGKPVDDDGKKLFVEPDFAKDACRIHVSQKTDIDENFKLAEGSIGNVRAQSGVGLKADAVRIMSRSGGIKLVTNTDAKNSRGDEIPEIKGIDLIAGNDDEKLQPIPLGDNLVELLEAMITQQENTISVLETFLQLQQEFDKAAGQHYHFSPFFGKPTTPSETLSLAATKTITEMIVKCKKDLFTLRTNLANIKATYLSTAGGKYILSRLNHSN
jgi:hypothetical protein